MTIIGSKRACVVTAAFLCVPGKMSFQVPHPDTDTDLDARIKGGSAGRTGANTFHPRNLYSAQDKAVHYGTSFTAQERTPVIPPQ